MAGATSPGTNRWRALAVLTMPVVLMSVDLTVLSMAIPSLSEHLSPNGNQLLWIIDIYGVFLAGLLVLMGSIGDRIGRRTLLLTGAVTFGAASALAAFAWTPTVLIVARALLGIGGATLMPSTLALIRSIFTEPTERRRAISIWAAAFAGGAGLGPVLGGVLLEYFWWGSVFLINIPIMVLLVILGPLLLPNSKDPAPGPFAPLSALMLTSGILMVIYGLKEIGKNNWSPASIPWMVAGLLVLAAFTMRQRRMLHPLIDVKLFRSLPFSVAVIANVAGVFALTGILYYLPQYVQLVLQKSAMEAGLWALPIALSAIVGAVIAPPLARRLSVRWIIGVGLLNASAGYLVLAQIGVENALALACAGGGLIGLGVGLADTLANDVIVATAPPERAGAAAGISESAYELGGAMGTAILGSLGASVYRARLDATLPKDFPPELGALARETLGNVTQIAPQLPPDYRAELLNLANAAFVDGMNFTFMIGAIIVFFAAAGAVLILRSRDAERC